MWKSWIPSRSGAGSTDVKILDTDQVRSWEHQDWKSWISSRSGAGSTLCGNPGHLPGRELGARCGNPGYMGWEHRVWKAKSTEKFKCIADYKLI